MAIETKYVVGTTDRGAPTINRVILVDGAEVSRGEPDFEEVSLAAPAVIELYFDAVSVFLAEKAALLDNSTEFTADAYLAIEKIRAFAFDFMTKFDQKVLMAAPGYPYFDAYEPPPAPEETLDEN